MKVDLLREYCRLYQMFYGKTIPSEVFVGFSSSIRDYCVINFEAIPFRGTCISLDDFDETHKYQFEEKPESMDVDGLISFCEYTLNLVVHIPPTGIPPLSGQGIIYSAKKYMEQMNKVLDLVGYKKVNDDPYILLVPDSPTVNAVAELTDARVSHHVFEYHHRSMKGDLEGKLSILKLLADEIEPKRKDLKSIASSVENGLFQLLDKFVRHNNRENPVIASMSEQELEAVYDDIYQMWLLAMLELDIEGRKKRARELLGRING